MRYRLNYQAIRLPSAAQPELRLLIPLGPAILAFIAAVFCGSMRLTVLVGIAFYAAAIICTLTGCMICVVVSTRPRRRRAWAWIILAVYIALGAVMSLTFWPIVFGVTSHVPGT